MQLPFLSEQEEQAYTMVTLTMRPLVCAAVPGVSPSKTMETRFFAPGSLVSNLDFVETIFGNAGDPSLPENNAALDVEHWSGHTGCVILAPHLSECKKKDLGLPHYDDATERQRRDGMCWKDPDECYNDGGAFKITCRDERGIVVTLIADNYFGYCKKEVKTQLSYAANLYGNCEEEHAGGALAYARFNLGDKFHMDARFSKADHSFAEMVTKYAGLMDVQPEGYGIDKRYPDVIYLPEDVELDLNNQRVSWTKDGQEQSITLSPNHTYVNPDGATGCTWRSTPAPPRGASWAPASKALSVTSPARYRAAASQKSPSHYPTPSITAPSSWRITRRTSRKLKRS
jgi:hypothetical protein